MPVVLLARLATRLRSIESIVADLQDSTDMGALALAS